MEKLKLDNGTTILFWISREFNIAISQIFTTLETSKEFIKCCFFNLLNTRMLQIFSFLLNIFMELFKTVPAYFFVLNLSNRSNTKNWRWSTQTEIYFSINVERVELTSAFCTEFKIFHGYLFNLIKKKKITNKVYRVMMCANPLLIV